jgi:putative pyruvate formate lyase activating enzyme
VLVRHLVMPHGLAGTREIARWLATELSPDTYVNVMDQYHPEGAVVQAGSSALYADVRRRITVEEFRVASEDARAAGLLRLDERGTGFRRQNVL